VKVAARGEPPLRWHPTALQASQNEVSTASRGTLPAIDRHERHPFGRSQQVETKERSLFWGRRWKLHDVVHPHRARELLQPMPLSWESQLLRSSAVNGSGVSSNADRHISCSLGVVSSRR
jgi:hypothetical protein